VNEGRPLFFGEVGFSIQMAPSCFDMLSMRFFFNFLTLSLSKGEMDTMAAGMAAPQKPMRDKVF
jgi:hypothetical protein